MSITHVSGRFDGKTAVVTGAGSGVGRATTLRLAAEGANVFALDIAADALAETATLAEGLAGKVSTRVTDVSSRDECFAAVAEAVAEFGGLDVLGNVAGIARAEHILDVTEAQYRRMMGVNTDGYFFMCQAAIPHLLERSGNIVNIASNAGVTGQAYGVVYTMSKGAVVQLTRSLAWEFAKKPLRVNAIAPGMVDTALVANYQMPSDVDWDLVGRVMAPRPAAQPEDIASMFAYVASAEAHNVHGAILANDSGLTAG
ncbi:SDR family oxidoreductase [Streptomyces sp. SID3343]|uniref:SDR family NAD(P)-dependent oxidoreductase n=1 Tax=Streptomyces sp. SID3343 TaxID=2690260 RepID=UPI0019255665|nr:SDR family oxidoreductase [Streptomyces sp. SID3343]